MVAKIIRISFLVAVSLLIASGALLSDDSTAETSRALSKAGYLFFAVILLAIIAFLGFLYRRKNDLIPEDLIVRRMKSDANMYWGFYLAADEPHKADPSS